MAKKTKQTKEKKQQGAGIKDITDKATLKRLKEHHDASDRYVSTHRDTWDEKETMLLGTLDDEYSKNEAKSQVYDPRLSTVTLERAARVMGQLPKGKSLAVSKDDRGKNMLMNLCVDKYVLPNARSQFDYLIKSRLFDVYSLAYGVMFGLVDWVVDERRGYVGPDYWIIPIRDVFPQAGAISVNDSEHFQISTFVSYDWLSRRDKKTWINIDEILTDLKNGGGKSKDSYDGNRRSHIEQQRHNDNPKRGVELITEYCIYGGAEDKGEWITYAPDYQKILRQIDNPHKNGELPIVAKHAFPLLDSIFGLGEFERGKTLQYAINSLINLYLDGVKMSIFPPTLINPQGVVPSTIKNQPAARWLVRDMNAVQQLQISPQGISTFQSTYSFLIAALMNQAGTTDTTVGAGIDPGLGKTPEALKQISQRESSRDNWDRFMMEQTQEEILKKFANLIAQKQEKPIKMRLFGAEIEEIAQLYPDVVDMYESGERGEVTIDKSTFSNTSFDYQITPGSTAQADKEKEVAALSQMMEIVIKNPQFLAEVRRYGKDINFAELFTRFVSMNGVTDWDKIVVDASPEQAMPQQEEQIPMQGVPQEQQQPQPQQQIPPQMNGFQDQEIAQLAQQLQGMQL